MSTTATIDPRAAAPAAARPGFGERLREDQAYQAFVLLRVVFAVAPILFGLDKFFNVMVDWTQYLAPWIDDIVPGSAQDFMYFAGVVEIAAGLLVLAAPWIGGFVVAAWLGGIVVNLLTNNPPEYYDIALRDFGLFLAALALGRLAWAYRTVPASKRTTSTEPAHRAA